MCLETIAYRNDDMCVGASVFGIIEIGIFLFANYICFTPIGTVVHEVSVIFWMLL